MNSLLKREFAYLTALFALIGRKRMSPSTLATLAGTAAGLFLASRKTDYDYVGKAAYITGGSRGLGLSLAWNLLSRGADVALVARDEKELDVAEKTLRRDFQDSVIHISVCDITDRDSLRQSFMQAVEALDGIDILINNAGAMVVGPFVAMEREDFEAQMNLHFYAALDAIRCAREHFKSRGGGRILNVCSLGGKVGVPHMAPYDASKFALAGFAQGIRGELANENICMTTAFPAVMRTGSPIQTVFKGDHETEFKVFETLDTMPILSMSADVAAKKMLDALASGRSEVVLSTLGQARIAFGAFFPEIVNFGMELAARALPDKVSFTRKTGAEIAGHRRRSKEEVMYNQIPRHDAEFNLGV